MEGERSDAPWLCLVCGTGYEAIGDPPWGSSGQDPDVTMFIGPARSGEPLEVGVVVDEDGAAVIHAMPARPKFLKGWWLR